MKPIKISYENFVTYTQPLLTELPEEALSILDPFLDPATLEPAEPLIPKCLYQIDVENFVIVNLSDSTLFMDFNPAIGHLLTHQQRHIVACNVLAILPSFWGLPLTDATLYEIKSLISQKLDYLKSLESKPGEFGQNEGI